jgi:hypothetical protein
LQKLETKPYIRNQSSQTMKFSERFITTADFRAPPSAALLSLAPQGFREQPH